MPRKWNSVLRKLQNLKNRKSSFTKVCQNQKYLNHVPQNLPVLDALNSQQSINSSCPASSQVDKLLGKKVSHLIFFWSLDPILISFSLGVPFLSKKREIWRCKIAKNIYKWSDTRPANKGGRTRLSEWMDG